jgi:hypothetical protein
MSKGFNAGMEEIRQENTQYALFHINKTPELLAAFMDIKSNRYNNGTNTKACMFVAEQWAEKHKNTFGDLFQTELELVRWNKLLKLL